MSGMIAIYSQNKDEDIAPYLHHGILSLQHRGQEGYGFMVNNKLQSGKGLISDAALELNKGHYGMAYVKYAFTQDKKDEPMMPLCLDNAYFGMDGSIEDKERLFSKLLETDSDYKDIFKDNRGAYAVMLSQENRLIAMRDAWGIKPFTMGNIGTTWFVASESCALEAMGVENIRDINPGEVVVFDDTGMRSILYNKSERHPCLFEYIYIARPDSVMNHISIHEARIKMGETLFEECPTEADLVIGAPDSGLISALGYARASNIPYDKGIVKNRYIGRTFINSSSKIRKKAVNNKLSAIPAVIEGKDIILVEDSIVRGTTIGKLIKILKDHGAKKVHVRVASPPIRYEENYSIDIPHKEDLLAYNKTVEEIREEIGCDSLYYLSLDGLKKACGNHDFYTQYFDGISPFKGEN